MSKTIAVFGGSFSPPGVHHRRIAEELTRHFDEVYVVPHGSRPDKTMVNDVDSIYRATMTDLTFRGLRRVHVDLFDLEQATFTRTHLLQERFAGAGDVWHVVGTALIESGKNEQSFVHQIWEDGKRLPIHTPGSIPRSVFVFHPQLPCCSLS